MAKCSYCEASIKNAEAAIYDGEKWYCTYVCLGKARAQDGGVPA